MATFPLEPPNPSARQDSEGFNEALSTATVSGRGKSVADSLAAYTGPAYRRAYLAQLLRGATDFLAAGKQRAADHFFDKVETELRSASDKVAGTRTNNDPQESETWHGEPGEKQPNPLDLLGIRWQSERMTSVENVLNRHAFRLTSLERKLYRESLSKWRPKGDLAPPKPGKPMPMARVDSALLELRRKLYYRILKSQKAGLARRSVSGPSVGLPKTGIIGPYNDRHNLEGVFALLGQVDPAWIEEFLELYAGLSGLRAMIPANR